MFETKLFFSRFCFHPRKLITTSYRHTHLVLLEFETPLQFSRIKLLMFGKETSFKPSTPRHLHFFRHFVFKLASGSYSFYDEPLVMFCVLLSQITRFSACFRVSHNFIMTKHYWLWPFLVLVLVASRFPVCKVVWFLALKSSSNFCTQSHYRSTWRRNSLFLAY